MKKRKYTQIVIVIFCLVSGIFITSPGGTQYSGATLFPINTAVGYGNFFNPYIFWPGSTINAAASASPLITFSPLINGNQGSGYLPGALSQLGSLAFNPYVNLLGFGNPLSSLSLLGVNFLNPLLSFSPLTLPTPGLSASFGTVSPIRTAAQTGTWTGTWTSTYIAFIVLFHSGPMMLNIVEDLLGTVAGTTILQGSRYSSALTSVAGVLVNNVITLEGFLITGFDIGLTCYLTSPTTMSGFYTVYGTNTPILDQGVFELTLTPPVII